MADGIVNLLKRPDERARLAEAGRKYVEKHFVWERSIAKLERMWLEAAAQGKAIQAAQ
jgi:glycosyltransferase involved in cell wall biosynthesis